MALVLNKWVTVGSASQTKPVSTEQGIVYFTLTYYLEAKLTSQSVAMNRSFGQVRARVTRSGGWTYSSSMTASCSYCGNYSGIATPEATLTSGTFEIGSNSVGESAIHLTGTLTAVIGDFSISVDAWTAIPTIPRASKPTYSTNPLTIGGTQTITTNRASSDFTHKLVLSVGEYSTTLNGVGASITWTPTTDLMQYMTRWQMPVTVTCTTYSGSTTIGSSTTSFTLQVDTSVYKPVITVGTMSDVNANTAGLTNGTFIKDRSILSVVISASPNDSGDSIASVTATLGSYTRNVQGGGTGEVVSFQFQATTTTNTLVITATDQRGYTVTKTVALTLLEYSDIVIQSVEYARVNANNVEAETGEYVRYTIKANAFLGSFGRTTNSITVSTRSKLASASDYGASVTEKTVTTSGSGMGDITITGVTVGTYSPSNQFDILFILTDALSSATATPLRVHEGIPIVAWGEDHFDVYGSFHIHDRDDVMKYITVDADSVEEIETSFSGATGNSVTWTVFKFGNLRMAVTKWRSVSNATVNTAWGSLYSSSSLNTPNFPFTFSEVLFGDVRYVAADNNSTYTAALWVSPQVNSGDYGGVSGTNMGSFALYRPDSGATIGHPVFMEIVIGTV